MVFVVQVYDRTFLPGRLLKSGPESRPRKDKRNDPEIVNQGLWLIERG